MQQNRSGFISRFRTIQVFAALGAIMIVSNNTARADDAATPYKMFRYDDNFTYLRNLAKRDDFWDPIKYVPFGAEDYITFGGELRERIDDFSEPGFGLIHHRSHLTDLLQRLLVNADAHFWRHFRLFVQLGNHVAAGKGNLRTPTDEDRLDLQQGFIDLAGHAGAGDLTIRLGRQEMAYGSQRLVSVREPPNIRRSFDGVHGFYKIEAMRIDAFLTKPVKNKVGIFDDEPDPQQTFWGLYSTMPVQFTLGLHADLYYLGLHHQQAPFVAGMQDELRHTFGTRLWGADGGWDYNWEFDLQTGRFGRRSILAGAISTTTGYTFQHVQYTPRLGLKVNIASGNGSSRNGPLATFNPLFPKLGYFTEAEAVIESNLIDAYPSLAIHPMPSMAVTFGSDFLWRENVHDGFYQAPFVPLIRNQAPLLPLIGLPPTSSRFIGVESQLAVYWQIDRHINLVAAYVHFQAGRTITAAGGHTLDFIGTRISYQF